MEIASYKRCSRPLCSSQTTTPNHTPHTQPPKRVTRVIGAARKPETNKPGKTPGPVASGPNSVPNNNPPDNPHPFQHPHKGDTVPAWKPPRNNLSVDIPPSSTHRRTNACAMGSPANRTTNTWEGRAKSEVLLRKEVIQPHLPVRLPCYDFVPIADPTFDSSLPKGWATGFGCYRLS